MDGAHLHLLVNHLPIIIPAIGLFVMFLALVFKSESIKRTGYAILILGALFMIPAFGSGEGAEEAVENIAGVDEELIEAHEETAEAFAVLLYIVGALAALGLWASWKEKQFSEIIYFLSLGMCLVVLYFGFQTGLSGGIIRHTEINTGVKESVSKTIED